MTSGRIERTIRRCAAKTIDVLAAALLAFVFALGPVGTFFARRAVVTLHIGEPGTLWKGPIPMLMGIAGTFVYSIPLALLIVALIETVTRTSLGKWLLLTQSSVAKHGIDDRRGMHWRRALARTSPWIALTLALIVGAWQLALIGLAAALLVPLTRLSTSH